MNKEIKLKTYKCGCFGGPMQFCRLHASAPELYEALRGLLSMLSLPDVRWRAGDNDKYVDRAHAAIAKAEGLEK